MFLLDELPSREILERYSKKYDIENIDAVEACLRVLKLGSLIMKDLELHFGSKGISLARFIAMIVIEREQTPDLNASDIAQKMGISKKNISRLLNQLEESAFIKRSVSEVDARVAMVELTAKGSRVIKQTLPGYYEIIQRHFGSVNKKSLQNMTEVLEKVILTF